MTWSYSGNPGQSPKDLTRFLIGDTDKCDPLLNDEEIVYLIKDYNNAPIHAAIRCCETIMAKFSRYADESVGQVKISYSQKVKGYRDMRRDLVNRLADEDMTPYAGGISVSDVKTQELNTNRVRPDFTKHMMANWTTTPWIGGNLSNWTQVGSFI